MKKLATTPLSWLKLIVESFRVYPVIFPQIILLVVVSALAHLIIPGIFVWNNAVGLVMILGAVLLTWFLYTAVLTISQSALELDHPISLKAAFALARQRFLRVLGSNIVYFAIGAFLMLFEFALDLAFDLIYQHPTFVVISMVIDVFVLVLLYFAIPLIVLDKLPILKAFENSVRLVKGNWWRTFIVLAVVVAIILGFEALGILLTGQHRMLLFTFYHFILQVAFYPLIVAVTLVLLNDLKLRHRQTHAEQQVAAHVSH